jgi:membrane protease YdiL (CAAX protease family)
MTPSTDRASQTLLCAGVFMVWYAITVLVGNFPHIAMLKSNGLLMPLLCLLEFCALVPLYRWYSRHYADIAQGQLRLRQALLFTGLLLAVIASQSLYLRQESWAGEQLTTTTLSLVGFALAVVVLAPVFEEILFRGFILQAFLLWAPRQRAGSALLASIIFAAMHTQYAHLQTIIALTVLSLLLCAARFVSGGLKLPVMLHMLNNLLSISPLLWNHFSRQAVSVW